MSEKDLKINFRYLTGNIACMSIDSASGKPVHNDIDNEEAIILFNSLVGEKEDCRTVKTLLQENKQLKAENYRLEHNEKVLLQREERAINYIDQVIMYKPCAREIDKELDTLIGILRGGNNER